MTNREATVALNLLPGIGPLRVNQLLTCFGECTAILSASESALARVAGVGPKLAHTIARWEEFCDLAGELAAAERCDVRILTQEDEAYPEFLREIHDPPLCLYVRGQVDAVASEACIAMVGSRRTTAYGTRMAEALANAAAFAGWLVVSGMARGIDTVVHRAALRAGGRTVAVLGSGLGRIYPQSNVELSQEIARNGAVISEFPLGYPPDRRSFPMRNRIISGICRGTVVIEAGLKSGSLITAGQALEQGRQVFAVPGPADSPQSKGCHALIRDGARLVESFTDVLEEFTVLPGLAPSTTDRPARPVPSPLSVVGLTEPERQVLAEIGRSETDIDALIERMDLAPGKVLATLVRLEMRHLVRQLPGRRVCAMEGVQG
jgi:DNA processing protein